MSESKANNSDKKKQDMDSKSTLTKALAAGAIVMFRPNLMERPASPQREIDQAYLDLKELLQEKYEQIDVDILDFGPGSAERQQAIAQKLQDSGASEDEEILRQAQIVLDLIREEDPAALWASEPAKPPAHLQ
jgi:hypothetical protein